MNIEQAIAKLAQLKDRIAELERMARFVADPCENVDVTVFTRGGSIRHITIERSELAAILQREMDDIAARRAQLQPVVDLANVALRGVA